MPAKDEPKARALQESFHEGSAITWISCFLLLLSLLEGNKRQADTKNLTSSSKISRLMAL